jgi:hypothetical protein
MRHIKFGIPSIPQPLSLALLTFALLVSGNSANAQDIVPGAEDACIEALGYLGCEALNHPNTAQQRIVVYWGALAVSSTTLRAGASHGENSQEAAEETAVSNCRRNGPTDCKVVDWAWNKCLALAISYHDKAYGFVAEEDRNSAAAAALHECRTRGGKNCVVITTPCARDDRRWSAPLPLPPRQTSAKIDPSVVGTWEYLVNPGRWIWRIASNGTYEFHSEAGDGAPSHAGILTASQGQWTIQANNIQYADGGTYKLASPGSMVATGRLGTGTWHRIASGNSD